MCVINVFLLNVTENTNSLCPSDLSREDKCCWAMANAGIKISTFTESAAHGIHSITTNHLNYYFDAQIEERNNIPTTNFDLHDKHPVIPFAPKIGKASKDLTHGMVMFDYILSNSDDVHPSYFMINGISTLEKLAHQMHMEELYAKTR